MTLVTKYKLLFCMFILPLYSQISRCYPSEHQKPFYMGVSIYEYYMAQVAKKQGKDYSAFLEQHLDILRKKGVNYIYLGGTSTKRFEEHLRLAEKYGMKLIPQLDFVYFLPDWSEKQMNDSARRAGQFIRKYNHYPQILAWSVKEEVAAKDIYRLAEYYTKILGYTPDAKFQLTNNNISAATSQPPPNPAIAGTPLYAFWWTECGDGYLASPSFSLRWFKGQAERYYEQAARRRADFLMIITQGGFLMPKFANIFAKYPEKITYPKTEAEKEKLRAKILTWAQEGRMGWKKITTAKGDFYNVWIYYRSPANCMKALA